MLVMEASFLGQMVDQGLRNFCEGPDSKYFSLCLHVCGSSFTLVVRKLPWAPCRMRVAVVQQMFIYMTLAGYKLLAQV